MSDLEKDIPENKQLLPVKEAKRPQGPEASAIGDYFNSVKATNLDLYPTSEHPVCVRSIDFYFGAGEDISLAYFYETQKGITPDDLIFEINQLISHVGIRDDERGEELKDQILSLMGSAHKIAYVACHGGTHDDKDGPIWGLFALDHAYGADRVMRALQKEGYDLVIFTACNTDDVPFQIELEEKPRPTIIRFRTDNSKYKLKALPLDQSPIKIIPGIK